MNDDEPVAVATDVSPVISDPAPLVGGTALCAVSVNVVLGSAAWSVAVVSPQLFFDGLEDAVVP